MKQWIVILSAALAMTAVTVPAGAVEVSFKPVADGVYAYIGDTEGRTYDNEGLNANIGLVITLASSTTAG